MSWKTRSSLAVRTPAGAGLVAGLLLMLPLACGDDTATGGAGGTTTSSSAVSSTHATASSSTHASSTSTAAVSTSSSTGASTASASGAGGSGGAGGGGSDTPVLVQTVVGTPLWEPADYHQFAAAVGPNFENFGDIAGGILPPPNHQPHPDLGIGPGDPHAGPYTGEMAAGVLANAYVEHVTYTQAQGSLPNGIMQIFMVVPSAGAPTGSSPDSASGPIIPNTIFPISVTVDTYSQGIIIPDQSFGFDVSALDDTLDPPFSVDGHSHFPLFFGQAFDELPAIPADLETRIEILDADGNGYDLSMVANAIP